MTFEMLTWFNALNMVMMGWGMLETLDPFVFRLSLQRELDKFTSLTDCQASAADGRLNPTRGHWLCVTAQCSLQGTIAQPVVTEGRPSLDLQGNRQASDDSSAAKDSLQLQMLAKMTGHMVSHLPNIWQLVQVP